jgi:rhamnose utilization protein RhaD (predicted bifunctional aldolase and dehydrogenase)/NAD(P)-dependent dehydrogenase (short-subunit alcohol dehydrogenase family)
MRSRWNAADAAAAVDRWARSHGEDMALRVYSSRLIGADPELVLHGGGNTSLKTTVRTVVGDDIGALFVKGSGCDLDAIQPAGFAPLQLAPLQRLRGLAALSEADMANQLRINRLDAAGPSPSVETLLHAFLPHRFIDHSHPNALLCISNQPDGETRLREAVGAQVAVVPYVAAGFPLARTVARAFEQQPDVTGVIVAKHGLFTFGDDARTAYERHIAIVDACEQWLAARRPPRLLTTRYRIDTPAAELAARVAPVLRGLLAERTDNEDAPYRRWLLDWRADDEVLAFVNSAEAATLAATGPLTPDHVIRTRAFALYVAEPAWDDPSQLRQQLQDGLAEFVSRYDAYLQQHIGRPGYAGQAFGHWSDGPPQLAGTSDSDGRLERPNGERCGTPPAGGPAALDTLPRVVLLPGAGALCFGRTKREARIAADITVQALHIKAVAHAMGGYEPASAAHLREMESWSLQQAKLGPAAAVSSATARPLERQVVLITGAAGAIGYGIAKVCAEAGAHVVLTDIDATQLARVAERIEAAHGPGTATAILMDVTDPDSVRRAFDEACRCYGGVDVIVPNAGVAHVAPVADLSSADLGRVMAVNFTGTFLTVKEGIRVLRAQGLGGNIVINSSKNVFGPGKDFGAYSASKAAGHQLGKVSAIELAAEGIRVNMINADAIFAEDDVPSGLWATVGPERARSRGLKLDELPDYYRNRNLLRARVRARHVGNAVVFFASNQTPTTGATLPVDGGVVEAFPR